MKKKNANEKKLKRVKKSIKNQIIATGLCPLVIMSTTVSILSLKGVNQMLLANIIALILFVGIIQLLYVAHNIVKPIRKAEEYINMVADGNLDVTIDEKMGRREDEIGSMSDALMGLCNKLKDSMYSIQKVSDKLVRSEETLERMVGGANIVTGQIGSAIDMISNDAKKQYEDMNEASININEIGSMVGSIVGSVQHLERNIK